METILIYLSLALVAGTLLMMLGFGLKNAGRIGGESKLGLAAFVFPVLVLVIAYAVTGSWTEAAVWTAIILSVSGLLALLASGARSLFS